eukprot:gnl/TRDRNA2_/TRDRNA2_137094_c4_seq4.p1 gnl/TRDRNA2_/TRDRNA2_137094_c4~~gnl/TRDRNA2_/TRDRNA2_137094_c4_seq4.p1  ORF type:complete len:139 (+),score=17.88 gnl/TRDRNA2_/TRDRNA2_137094_c4_seq4:109-525(+)
MREAQMLSSEMVVPWVKDLAIRRALLANTEYGVRHFEVLEAAWRVMAYGQLSNRTRSNLALRGLLNASISDYDAAQAGYQSLGLLQGAPSLFFDYWFSEPGEPVPPGLGATVDSFRSLAVEETWNSQGAEGAAMVEYV